MANLFEVVVEGKKEKATDRPLPCPSRLWFVNVLDIAKVIYVKLLLGMASLVKKVFIVNLLVAFAFIPSVSHATDYRIDALKCFELGAHPDMMASEVMMREYARVANVPYANLVRPVPKLDGIPLAPTLNVGSLETSRLPSSKVQRLLSHCRVAYQKTQWPGYIAVILRIYSTTGNSSELRREINQFYHILDFYSEDDVSFEDDMTLRAIVTTIGAWDGYLNTNDLDRREGHLLKVMGTVEDMIMNDVVPSQYSLGFLAGIAWDVVTDVRGANHRFPDSYQELDTMIRRTTNVSDFVSYNLMYMYAGFAMNTFRPRGGWLYDAANNSFAYAIGHPHADSVTVEDAKRVQRDTGWQLGFGGSSSDQKLKDYMDWYGEALCESGPCPN
ncbi:MAG: hypothetical protein AAF641_15665 [Pseudomonadota bacterium]